MYITFIKQFFCNKIDKYNVYSHSVIMLSVKEKIKKNLSRVTYDPSCIQ